MRIAYLMNGVVGGLTGKNFQRTNEELTEHILEYCAHTHNHLHNDHIEIDYFIFSWEPNLDTQYKSLFNPKKYHSEIQKTFNVAPHYDHIKNNPRIQAHYSRWYGAKKVFEMCEEYMQENDITYDLVINARIDLCYHNNVNFTEWDTMQFHIAKSLCHPNYNWPKNIEITDHIFASNFSNMKEFFKMYDLLDTYTKPGQCPQWNHISSHFLSVWHLRNIGLLDNNIISESLSTRFDSRSGVDYHIFRYLELTEQELITQLNRTNSYE